MRYELFTPDGLEIGYVTDEPEFRWEIAKDAPFRDEIEDFLSNSSQYQMVVAGELEGTPMEGDAVTPPEENVPVDDYARLVRVANALPKNVPVQVRKGEDFAKSIIAQNLANRINKGRRYVDSPDEAPDDAEVQEGPQGGYFYETDERNVEAPDDADLWINDEGVWEGIARHEDLTPGMLTDYLTNPPQEATDYLYDGEFGEVLNNSENAARFNDMVTEMDSREAVSFLFMAAVQGKERNARALLPAANNRSSDFADHGPFAAVVKQMDDQTVDHIAQWADSTDAPDNKAIEEIKNAVARHGPYDVRRNNLQPARSAPYIGPDDEYYPEEGFYDEDADWLSEDADEQTFRDHLINHWTDSATSQGGVVAREAAFSLGQNPIWATIDEPYHGYNDVAVPYENPPGHISERMDRWRKETAEYYREQGVDSITLYRGVDQEVTTAAPLESWTDKPEEAERYAGEGGEVMEKEIPVENIVFSHESYDNERWNALAGWKAGAVEQDEGLREFAVLGGTSL